MKSIAGCEPFNPLFGYNNDMRTIEQKMQMAQTAKAEELWHFIKDPNQDVVSSTTLNRHLTEEMAIFIAKRHLTQQETLGFLVSDVRFKGSYKLKLAICRNPKCPPRISLGLIKFLRVFDLSDITRSQYLPVVLRQKVELSLLERIPSMPSGIKVALSKRANSTIILALMEKGDARVVNSCLESPVLKEEHLYRIIHKPSTSPHVIKMIAEHTKWSLRYPIRLGLIRNFHTPMSNVTTFIHGMRTRDLQELYYDPKLPNSTKPFIFRELKERNETSAIGEEKIFNLSGDEDSDLTETWKEIQ